MISTLFKKFVGSEVGFETPPPNDPPQIINYCSDDDERPDQILYMKVQRGKVVGWEPLN